jgi:tetratricopeptide (TPR) repeat protein
VGVQWNEHRRFQKSAESWGRVAVEAAASGIPAIAVPTPGLKESLGRAGCLMTLDAAAWSAEIERLFSDENYYRQRSTAALERSAELHPAKQLAAFEAELVKLTSQRRRSARVRDRIRHPVRALTHGQKYSVRDFERGATLEGLEDWLGAAEAYQAAVDGDASQGEWFYRLGFVQQKRRAWDEAAEAFQAAVDRDASQGEWFYRLGFVQQKRRAWDEAASAYRTALELNPDEPRWIRRLETVQNRALPGRSAS